MNKIPCLVHVFWWTYDLISLEFIPKRGVVKRKGICVCISNQKVCTHTCVRAHTHTFSFRRNGQTIFQSDYINLYSSISSVWKIQLLHILISISYGSVWSLFFFLTSYFGPITNWKNHSQDTELYSFTHSCIVCSPYHPNPWRSLICSPSLHFCYFENVT